MSLEEKNKQTKDEEKQMRPLASTPRMKVGIKRWLPSKWRREQKNILSLCKSWSQRDGGKEKETYQKTKVYLSSKLRKWNEQNE